MGGEERRQPGDCRVDQHCDAPFRQRADLANGDGDHVRGESNGLAVEIAAGQCLASVR